MRIASYNVENLFARAKALNLETWAEGRPILERFAALNDLFEQPVYTPETKTRMLELLREFGLEHVSESKFVILRTNRGDLIKRSRVNGTSIVANGRDDWIGWLELKTEIINEVATRNTAQVIRDLDPDVLGVIECESRKALQQLSSQLMPSVGAKPFDTAMLIDGNDDRGIDVGLLTRRGYVLNWMKSHVDDLDEQTRHPLFSRDCPEFGIFTPSGLMVWVLVNHFKSKGYGRKDASDRKRQMQAMRVAQITQRLQSEGAALIAVLGDLNDTPDSEALAPLLTNSGFRDIAEHPSYDSGGFPGTYQQCSARDKIDYILLSPAMFERVQQCGIWRKGVWGTNKTPKWEVYPEMTSSYHAASDHGALWVDIDV